MAIRKTTASVHVRSCIPYFTRGQLLSALLLISALACIIIGALASEGLRCPAGAFGDLGKSIGPGGIAGLFAGGLSGLILSIWLWLKFHTAHDVECMRELVERYRLDFELYRYSTVKIRVAKTDGEKISRSFTREQFQKLSDREILSLCSAIGGARNHLSYELYSANGNFIRDYGVHHGGHRSCLGAVI